MTQASQPNTFFNKERNHNHANSSLEAIVQNLACAFEMEASFKTNPQQWVSVVADKFRMSTNGGTYPLRQKTFQFQQVYTISTP